MITLITGGARSGKTRYALDCANEPVLRTYIATAQLLDDEMRERAARHQRERGEGWRTLEEPFEVASRVRELSGVVVVDCLTLWLSNWMCRDEEQVERQIDLLCSAFRDSTSHVRAITNEVGSSIVPESSLARRFRDWSGLMNQRVAGVADSVVMMVCGIPTRVK
ncbi:MAG TPA: bifunctional adenosylcobinamide kinase/adenosylcobinamide-phosphate guanylyltransferase [Terriglobia bacterium]|nr:bifunctional adenosylcobinamide kinase/adenosylcobinamide-phosphate guanylyltransferase [Terriglobia bacterium]